VTSFNAHTCNVDNIIETSFVFDNSFEIFLENLIWSKSK